MAYTIQLIVEGFATGSIYGALALAIVLVNRSTGLINFAQGAMAVLPPSSPSDWCSSERRCCSRCSSPSSSPSCSAQASSDSSCGASRAVIPTPRWW